MWLWLVFLWVHTKIEQRKGYLISVCLCLHYSLANRFKIIFILVMTGCLFLYPDGNKTLRIPEIPSKQQGKWAYFV